jgi:hypothetical protein
MFKRKIKSQCFLFTRKRKQKFFEFKLNSTKLVDEQMHTIKTKLNKINPMNYINDENNYANVANDQNNSVSIDSVSSALGDVPVKNLKFKPHYGQWNNLGIKMENRTAGIYDIYRNFIRRYFQLKC